MRVSGLQTKCIQDFERSPHQRFGFLDPVGVFQQKREVVQIRRDEARVGEGPGLAKRWAQLIFGFLPSRKFA